MERIARNENHDEVFETFRELVQTLLNPHWESFVDTEKFEKLKSREQSRLSVHSVLLPSVLEGFASVTMAAANFRDSMIYQLWKAKGVDFRESKALGFSLRFQEHQNGHLDV